MAITAMTRAASATAAETTTMAAAIGRKAAPALTAL